MKTRIILAEDDPSSRRLLVHQLEQAGFEVSAFDNGLAALEAVRAAGRGLVVADWNMPVMDGPELCRQVERLRSAGAVQNCFVILLTAHADKARIVEGLEAGANDYLTKPYHKAELLARIRAGQRIYELQDENWRRRIELERKNAQLDVLARKLERLAHTDGLTGLANRRCAAERLAECWAAADRSQRPLSCVLLDIDHFKRINDAHGHAAGDDVLRHVAHVARGAVRLYDFLARFGGEEFLILCPDTDACGAAAVAERVRLAVRAQPVIVGGVELAVTLSAGAASRCASHAGPDDLVAAADELLYQAKHSGRDQVWLALGGGRARFEPQAA